MEISLINYGNDAGKGEGNLQSGDEISIGNLSVIYLQKFHRYFVGEFVSNTLIIGDHFYRHSVDHLL